MKEIKNIQIIKSADIDWFAEEIIRVTGELQEKKWQLEYDYKPLINNNSIFYTCMVRAFVEDK